MKYADINKKYTSIIAEYMAKGYTLNTRTMSGSQGEFANIDLTDGTEVIRVLVAPFQEWTDISLEGAEIIVGRANAEIKPNSCEDHYIIWNNRLDIISTERFYEIATKRSGEKIYGTREEAVAAQEKRYTRWAAKNNCGQTEDVTEKAMGVALKVIRNKLGITRIIRSKVKVEYRNGQYTISYNGKCFRIGKERRVA